MSTASRKGYYAEVRVVDFLNEVDSLTVDRQVKHGTKDRGDVAGLKVSTIDVKNRKQEKFSQWLKRGDEQAVNARARIPWVAWPQRGKPVSEWYAVIKWKHAREIIALLETMQPEHLEAFFTTMPQEKPPRKKKAPRAIPKETIP